MRPNPQETAGFVTFTQEILNGKLHFLCSAMDLREDEKKITWGEDNLTTIFEINPTQEILLCIC